MKEFEQIIGYTSIKKELILLADMMTNIEKYKKIGAKLPRGILLFGDPGVGKTLMANCLINASRRKVFTIRKNIPDGDFVKHIQDTFTKATTAAPSIVFLDDIDKFANTENENSNEEAYVAIQSCIDNIKEFDVFVVATANDERVLPKSLIREGRLGRSIHVQNPQGADAVAIVKHFLSTKQSVGDLDAKDIAMMLNGNSCADLESAINEASIYAASQEKDKIDMEDLIRGILRIKFGAPESVEEVHESKLLATAYHEAGHAVIAEVLSSESVSIVSVLAHIDCVKGITNYYQDDTYWDNKTNMENRVTALLGGKAATEIVYGKTDLGANRDIQRAFDIISRFVDDYCSTSFDSFERLENSDCLSARKEERMTFEIEKFYAQAKKILAENRPFLDAVAKALVEKKSLVSSDIQKIKASVG